MLEEKDYLKKQINLLARVLKALLTLSLKKGDNIEERVKEAVDDDILGHHIDLWLKMDGAEYESALKKKTEDAKTIKQFLYIQLEISAQYFTKNELDKSLFYFKKSEITKNYYDSISATYDFTILKKYNQLKNVLDEI